MLNMKVICHMIPVCICMLASFAERINGQHTFPSTTVYPEAKSRVNACPFMLITPSQQYADFGKTVRFSGVIEASLEFPTDARWQKIRNGNVPHNLDLNNEKYSGSDGLSPSLLVINTVDFDDAGDYRLEVKISTGWCSSNTVSVPHVYGILQYNAVCTHSRECDERKQLRCSSTNTCLCHSSYYPYTQICYWKSDLRVSLSTSSISASLIQFQWRHPSHSNLIDDYTVRIRHDNGTIITGTTVGKQTSYSYHYDFVPGYRYYFRITSNVRIPNPSEQFTVDREWSIVLAPLPPGLIDRHNSSFHPEKLHLKWAKPPNNTRVDYYSITISNPSSSYSPSSLLSSNELLVTNHRFKPGTNYTVTIRSRSYSTYSQPHTEEFETLRTPFLTITPNGWRNIPYLSHLVIQCTVVNNTDFPQTLETKWSRNQIDVNISDSKYSGSSLDVYKPKLVINRVDFDHDDDDVYRCAARNSEGWGTSERTLRIDVKGSIPFQNQCNRSKECLYGASLTCTSHQCLCASSYYHRQKTCYSLSYLRARSITVKSSTCDISINWWPPSRDVDFISGYEVFLQEYRNGWRSLDKIFVGNTTHYTTPCSLESGRLYQFFISSKINLRDPIQEKFVDSSYTTDILEPRKPGKIISSLSNFSADGLHLVWEESDAFVNRYRVEIDGHRRETLDSKSEIYWNRLLLPVTQYNVTITAISYGYVTNYPSYGRKESQPAANWIMTTESQYSGKAYMSYGDEDFVMTGDRVTSGKLRSPTTVYVGDGSSGGFNYVVVGSNGIIGLGENFNGESIHGMDSKFVKERQIFCPFWADLASSDDVGKVYYNTYRRGKEGENVDGMFMEKADSIVKKHFKDFGDFQATWLVKVTWENMTLYGHKDKKVTFQCFLITDGDNTFAVINYMDINMAPIENFNISIGYRYKKDLFVKNSFTKQKGAFRMSFIPGNRGERGFWIYKMSDGVQSRRDEKLCFFWYSYNIEKQIHHGLANVLNAIECPCDHRLLRFDPRYAINRFDKINRILCYASMTLGTNVECCYDMYANVDQLGPLRRSVPFAGTVLQYNPFFQRYQYTNYDSNPRKLCCSSGHCDWYYQVRPIPRCYRRSPFQPGINFGDPHITTLDGMDYTFNGFGEYTMLSINTSTASFILQARTELASSANGTIINATVFTAFVAEDHTGSKVQIEMARNKEELVIKGNGLDLTNRFKNESYIFMKQNLTISWQNQSIVATFLKTLNTIKISLGKRFLICETLINEKYKGQTIGLMGNFDGNKTNDFILPNGTSLPENATNSERKIYNHFGQLWSVNDASLFQYDDELTFKNFTHPEFVPMFTDEVDTGKLNEAKQKCGSNSSKACIADYLATGDIALAEISGKKEQVSKSDIKIIENEIPSITGNTTLFVEVDKEVEMKFNVSDDGKEKPKLKLLKYPNNFTLDDETSSARWLPQKNSIPEISIVAIDSHGAQSSSLEYQIIQCDGCGEHGDCDFENLLSTENDQFHKALCVCHVGYSGDQCSQDTNACSQSPCPLGRNCTDLTPEEEERLGRGYNCSSCPSGYTEVDNKCQDINECTSNNTNSCEKSKETCENTDGGYICNCLEGYRKLKDQCNDINECLEKSSGCEQGCQNTPGSFNCSCVPGYTLNADKRTCRKTDHDLCKNFNKQCEYACSIIDGITQCICPSGYELTDDGITCTDIDECKLETTPCDQDCINRNGSFQCTCRPGFALSADRTTCSRCELPNYGVNCSQECKCGPGVDRCDPVSGCVCQSGWTGNNCDTDIDECQENPAICGSAMICNNTEGSYRCDCQNGFQLLDGKCQDIDECADDLLNDCPLETTRCVNTYGDYNCDCQQGFQYNGSSCEDVDECILSTDKCSQKCENTPGGYNCLCFFGFVLKDDRISCEEEKDSCSLYPDLNCTYGCKKIDEHKGVCFCESGYELQDNGTCTDIDECKTSSTCAHNCTNRIGSFECSCAIGYRLGNDGSSCTACNQDFYGENCEVPCRCGRGSKECNHITGCICNEGWKGDSCEEDINECHLDNTCTGDHEVCVNSPGSYRCDCVKGYKNISGICQDINECEDSKTCHQLCFNTNGSYTCGCRSGYELTNSNDCIDIDECQKARCSRCSNWPGSFKCSCDDGYRLNLTTLNVCDNINECEEETHNCSTNATCTDTEGGFNCSCHVGLEGNGYNCTVCTGFHYGEQCSEECICNRDKSEGCDAVTGTCHCKAGWTGSDCTQDVDECETGDRTCNESSFQTCVNTKGSSHCGCLYGGVNITNCTRPLPPIPINDTSAKVKAEVHFDLHINRSTFVRESENLRSEFESQLKTYHEKEISGISSLVVLSIRHGSVYVEYEIVGPARFEKNVATVISKIFRGDIKLKISYHGLVNVLQVTIKYENGTEKASFTSDDDVTPCGFFKHMGGCPTGYYCEDSSSRAAECFKVKSDFSVIAIITISAGVGVPLLITIIVMVIVWKRVTKRTLKEKHERLSGDMTEYMGKIPRPSQCNEYDYIPSDAMPRYVYTKDIGCIERESNWDSLSEKLGKHQEFRIQRPNVHGTKSDNYMY